jgi:hypothetical protein
MHTDGVSDFDCKYGMGDGALRGRGRLGVIPIVLCVSVRGDGWMGMDMYVVG